MNKLKSFLLVIALIFAGFFVSDEIFAKDYDIYVDADADSGGDGSEDDPYQTVSEAIEEADDGDDIFIEKGDYEEDIYIDKEVSLYGDDLEDVVIEGDLEIEKNVEAEEFTIEGGVVVNSGADVIFDNLIITEASGIAIDASPGNGEIVVKNSVIKKADTKGFYIQKGRDIVITGCQVYGHDEEGIDLRSNVDGTISGNTVYDNGESGLEFIVSDSSLDIENNTFKNNGSNGIAAQYYDEFDDEGEINISGNTITSNDGYGIDCNNPQGGSFDADFWSKSMSLKGNSITSNKEGVMGASCKLSQEVSEEIKEQQVEERQEDIEKEKEEKEVQEKIEEENRNKTIESNKYELKKLSESKQELKASVEAEVNKIEGRNFLMAFLIGPNYGAIENIKEVAPGFGEHLSDFDDLERKLIDDSNSQTAQEEMDDIVNYVEEINSMIVEKDSKFSLFGWAFRMLS